jgi:hypothetical protein
MKLDIVCKAHPKYKAKSDRVPNCDACTILFFLTTASFGTKMVGVKQIGLAANPAVLVNRGK